ncbi:MAG: ABC transporter ATP-binding protein [Dehalococcoidia bacterium]|nr:ABC transporter ATP-binding protein [Dehalococcoidia bacterium]
MQNPGAAISARDIGRDYGERRALDGFSLEVPRGGVFGILGPNGSGKSTFLAMVAAMEQPAAGELRVLGEEPSRALRARVGTVFQENSADPLMRTAEYLRFAGRLFAVPGGTLNQRIPALLERFGLAQRARDPVSTLSGGMRRRLEVARALLHGPEILLLDEPTTGVDPEERRVLWDTLGEARGSTTVLLATNDLAEADAVCDRVAFVQGGRVVASGSPAELKQGLRRDAVRINWPGATADALATVASWPGTGDIVKSDGTVHVTADDASALVPRLFELAGREIRGVTIESSSLEDAYFQYIRRRVEASA